MIAALFALAAAGAAVPNDYGLEQNWLCRPGRRDSCTVPQDTTEIAGDGTLTVLPFVPAKDPQADCFYVYPTVSLDAGGNSDMVANREEQSVIAAQFSRFAAQCRTFAPLYRQVTLTWLGSLMAGHPGPADRKVNYADVRDAWRHYLAHDNGGRPVVLIGHSQGSGLLKQLIAEEIDGKPAQRLLLSAMLIGTNVLVASGKDVGGDFKSVPLCRSARQTGCVITWVTFREATPPPPKSRFARSEVAGREVACTNPGSLGANEWATLTPVFASAGSWDMTSRRGPWVAGKADPTTPFVSLPGLASAKCIKADGASYLAVRVNAVASDARTDELPGDVELMGHVQQDWGLHLIDVTIAYDMLAGLIPQQLAGWRR